MERLTTNKDVSKMGMLELAHNSCYIDENRCARYRDFETDIDARDFVRNLYEEHANIVLPEDNQVFDECLIDDLMLDTGNPVGLIALFYRNLWGMAELREKLKMYEDAEEQGLLAKVVHGEWIVTDEGIALDANTWKAKRKYSYDCSLCGYHTGNQGKYFKFCPNCGAKMDGVKEGVE